MRFLNRFAAPALVALVMAPELGAQAAMPADSLAHARHITELFFTARHDSVLTYFPAEDRAEVTVAVLQERLEGFAARAGLESEVLEEKFVKRNGMTQYWRTGKYTNYDEPIIFRWAFNKQGQIVGMGVGPASQAPPIDQD